MERCVRNKLFSHMRTEISEYYVQHCLRGSQSERIACATETEIKALCKGSLGKSSQEVSKNH